VPVTDLLGVGHVKMYVARPSNVVTGP
jgi:hypothetical protein